MTDDIDPAAASGDDAPEVVAMANKDAWLYAASWGSYMTGGDPGAVMYGFDESFRVQSEDHREKVRTWIETECRPDVLATPADYDADELTKMDSFLATLANTMTDDAWQAATAESRAVMSELQDGGDLAEFAAAYVEAALWNGVEYQPGHESAGGDKDSGRDPGDCDADTLRSMIADCRKFLTPANVKAIEAAAETGIRNTGASPMAQAGHDFWFTRTGAGVGFWDGDWPEPHATKLDKAAKRFSEGFYLYTGDNNRVYGDG